MTATPSTYLSIEGILGHLGFSQVFRVLEGLSQRGFAYSLVTLERAADLRDASRLHQVSSRARAAGIDWRWSQYREGGGARSVLANEAELFALASSALARNRPSVIHARAYHAALVASPLARASFRRWIFDARGYWIDERIEEGRWFTTPARERAARFVERRLFADADAVVTLTQLQADDVLAGEFGSATSNVVAVPTCADFDEFRPRGPGELERVPAAVRERLAGQRVLGIVGSLNKSYLGAETARLAAMVLQRDANALVLVLSAQGEQWSQLLASCDAPLDRVVVTKVAHDDVAEWMSLMTWGLLLLPKGSRAKRASMPTKLGEFLATGVRVCAHGCNEEMGAWVRRAGGGLVLDSVEPGELSRAADAIVSASLAPNLAGRTVAEPHFSLRSGLDRYAALLARLAV